MMKKHLLLAVLLCLSFNCFAEITLSVIRTEHVNSKRDYNEKHLALDWKAENSGWFLSYLNKNSHGDPSYLGGYIFKTQNKYFEILTPEFFIGAVHGYKDHIKINYKEKISPYFWLGVKVDTPVEHVFFRYRNIGKVQVFSLEYTF